MLIAGLDIRALVGDVAGPLLLPMTLRKKTYGARDPSDPRGGRSVQVVDLPCKGVVGRDETWEGGVRSTELRATLIAATIPGGVAPDVDDEILNAGNAYRVLHVTTDPASASHVCKVEG